MTQEPTGAPRLGGGRYELSGVLGRGGMAEVRKGQDLRLGRTVAVKRLRADLAADTTFRARFRREAQSAASLNHPAIVAVYDTGEEQPGDGRGPSIPYIVMEYVEGRTLREVLSEGRKVLPERALEITAEVLAALDYSHRAGIVHRDIKPANVMLTPSGDVKVMDFGIARAIADSSVTMTQTAAVVGTAQYLSPEQARGEQVDARSDIYSTGCLLFELLTGRPPFVGDSPVAVAYQHVREEAPAPSTIDPEIQPELDAITAKALSKSTSQRYQDAAEMRADIERALAGQAVDAPAVVTGVDGAGMFAFEPEPTTQDISAAAPQGNRRSRGWGYTLLALAVLVLFVLAGLFLPGLLSAERPAQATVPNLIGDRLPQARDRIEAANLEVGDVEPRTDDGAPAGEVLEQDPVSAEVLDEGEEVDLVVSAGTRQVEVPYLIGSQLRPATEELERLELDVEVTRRPGGDRRNQVIAMEPQPVTPVDVGATITLTVSAGPTEVPGVIGLTQEVAEDTILDSGLVPEVGFDPEADAEVGIVVSQFPGDGSQVEPGAVVTITVSSLSEETEPSPTPTPTPTTPSPTTPSPTTATPTPT
ncbi:MAG TPA: Stk1 family PASTA domain-containing Ser/Thr kinase, partial [Nocardioidaceae bacterium]|nr:Stk1 family PASTA domain-containing Ser/Thr kinase [Nocardioidaceae bacterium]